ncbi:deoxycytidylate deaminase-like [Mizuhopecten yessoensis]|uniref:deoxycytidylate deaminase-like n=1 Tax=Mizuhopecten yessoensis TaxID=6573 RepID=UPI000B4590C3|nr:deoxycytidylate deaminase-like [Mizuhopecten yessoensis]
MDTRAFNGTKTDDSPHHKLSDKRGWYINWDEYFMAIALVSAQRSKDPVTQVGACIVNKDNRIVGVGYNGMPNGCSDDDLPWGKSSTNILETKKFYVCHAEMNAIMNKISSNIEGCTIFVSLFPCNECTKIIIQSGIKSVVYYDDKNIHKAEAKASQVMLKKANIHIRKYQQHGTPLVLGRLKCKL